MSSFGAQISSETRVGPVQLFFFIQAKVILGLVNDPGQKPFYGSGSCQLFERQSLKSKPFSIWKAQNNILLSSEIKSLYG